MHAHSKPPVDTLHNAQGGEPCLHPFDAVRHLVSGRLHRRTHVAQRGDTTSHVLLNVRHQVLLAVQLEVGQPPVDAVGCINIARVAL